MPKNIAISGISTLDADRVLANAKNEANVSIGALETAKAKMQKSAAGVRFLLEGYERGAKDGVDKTIVSTRLSLLVDELDFELGRVDEVLRELKEAKTVFCDRKKALSGNHGAWGDVLDEQN